MQTTSTTRRATSTTAGARRTRRIAGRRRSPGGLTALGLTTLGLTALLSACASPRETLPAGEGLRAHDRTIPDGVATYAQPKWLDGDELVFRRGDRLELRFVVRSREDGGFDLEDTERGNVLVLDGSLAQLGERAADADADDFRLRFDPLDPSYVWPLWVGKRWTGAFTLRSPRGDVPVVARYHCDALETVETPAGTFEALRIWRADRVDAEGNYLERTTVEWYAPAVGYVVKRLEDGLATVLVRFHRQAGG